MLINGFTGNISCAFIIVMFTTFQKWTSTNENNFNLLLYERCKICLTKLKRQNPLKIRNNRDIEIHKSIPVLDKPLKERWRCICIALNCNLCKNNRC